MVISTVSWTGSMSKGSASNSITEFTILKCLIMVMARPSKSVTIKQVDWHLPISGYIKCNSDVTLQVKPEVAAFFDEFCWSINVR